MLRLLVAALAVFWTCAHAQTWPTKPIRLVVPFAPGGSSSIVARTLAAEMEKGLGQSIVVENKPGAGTVVGTEYVAKSAPDGYTMGFVVTA